MPPTPVTAETVALLHTELQSAITDQVAAETDYDATVTPFTDKRKALRAADKRVADAQVALSKALTSLPSPTVPPVPVDEEE